MAKSLRERAFGWIKKRKKERNTLTSTIKSAPSKPTRQTSEYHAPKQTKSSYSGGGGSVWNGSSRPASSGTKKETPKHAVGYRPAPKMAIGAKAKEQQTKAKSVAAAMKSNDDGLTAREKALKHNVQKAVLNVGNRVGKDYAKDLKSGLYTSKATEQEKKNVAKSIEKDYNKKAKSKKAEAIAGFTKSDANIKAVTKGVTGKDIDVSKVTKSKAYKGGDVAQELASYAIAPNEAAGKAVGKLAVKAIAKNALKKSGKKATKRVVNGAMQKAATEFAKSKGKTFASKRAGEVIANAPLNAKYAADRAKDEKTGKIDKKKFAKDFALNTGFDVGIGSAIGGVQLGKAAKAAKRSAREAKMGKMLDSRIKKVTKANKTVKSEAKVAPKTAKRVKAKVTTKKELNLGQAVKEEYEGINKRVEKGVISKREAKKQRKALANEFERRTGGTGVRLNKGYAEVTKKGLKEIKDSNNKLNFDRRIKNVEKIKDKIDKKAVKKEKAKTEFKGLTDEEIRQVEQEAKDARNIAEQDRLDRERAEIDEMANNQKGRFALEPFEAEEIDRAYERHLTDKYGKSVKQDYKDRVRLAQSQAKGKTALAKAKQKTRVVSKKHGILHGVTENVNKDLDDALEAYVKTGDDKALYEEVREQIPYSVEGYTKKFIRNYDGRTKAGRKAKADGKKKWSIYYEPTLKKDVGYYTEADYDDLAESAVEAYKDALATANPKAGKDIKLEYRGNQVDEAVEEAQPSRQEIAELFGETRRRQPKGRTVEGKLPARIKDKIDATAEAKTTPEISEDDLNDVIIDWVENDMKAEAPKAEAKAEPKIEETPKPKAESPIEPEGTAAQVEAESYGYHAGDLGKAEYARIQSGDRGTGHFGTGTYFVGDKNVLTRAGSGYSERPIHKINFSKYNLFKPKDNRAGINVHSSLKELDANARDMDGLLKDMTLDTRKVDDALDRLYQAEDAGDYDKYKEIADEVLTKSDYEAIDDAAVDRLETWKEYGVEDATKERAWRAEVGDRVEEKLKDLEHGNDYENFIPDLARDLGRSQDEVAKALENTRDILDKYPESAFSPGSKEKYDSAATVFMKELGYEGVDVRGLDALDDTRYGSVIYDLHPEDLPKVEAAVEKPAAKTTAEEPQSIVSEEKTAEPTNTSTTEETSLKSPENKKDDTITVKEDKHMDAVDYLDDTKMMTTHGDNLSDFSKKERASIKGRAEKAEAPETTKAPEPKETPELEDKEFKVSDHVSPEEKASGIAKFNSVVTDIRRKIENSMGFTEREAARWAKRNHQPEFAAQFSGLVNNMRQSTQRASYSFLKEQIDYDGHRVGESFSDIAKDIRGKSPEHYENVQDYLFLVNHADRVDASGMLPGEKGDKRLFDNLTADEARKMAQELIDKDPDLLKDANRIIRYFRNDLKSQAQAGLISWDTFYHYIDTQPNYVPAHRSGFGTAKLGGKPYKPNLKSLRAKGSGLDLLPIEDQAKLSTEYTFTRGATNDVSNAIAKMSGYSPETIKLYEDTNGVDATDIALFFDKQNGKLRFFDEGELRTVEVPEQYLKDIEDAHITATSSEGLNAILNGMGGMSRVFKELITSYNPAFVVKNFFRDFPEGALQSQNMGLYLKNLGLGKSFGSIATNDEWYRAYKRMGGQHGQFINSASDIFKEENWLKKNTLGKIEAWNEFTEQAPRLAEFRAYLEKLGKTPKTATPDELRRASEAAADVTVNFGRSGSIGRIINKSAVPFFNPAIQGFAKIGRVLTKDKSVSGYVKLLSKMAVLGAAPELVNEMIIGDNPNYQMINERDRAVNYYIPLDADNPLNELFGSNINGTKDGEVFLKIPKARFLSIIGMGTQSVRGTNDIPFADFVGISVDQIGPVGWENNIFQQFINSRVWDNKSKGKTWYGAEIENTGDQSKLPQDRYDEKTSDIAIELGKITGRSPKKIDYLLDSYTGVIGDIALPARASAAQRGGSGPIGAARSFLAKNFSTDSVSQNNLTNKVYERVDELTQKQGSGDTSAETDYGLRYFNKRNKKASEIRDKIRSIQNSSKSKEQKAREVRPLQRELNKLNKTTLNTEKSFVKAAKKYVDRLSNAPLADETKKDYGIENAMIATAKDRGEDPWKLVKEYTKGKYRPKYAKYAKKAGLSPVEYKEFYNLREYDLDGSGGMPSKKEVLSYFATRDDLTTEQKAVLYAGLGGWFAKGANPYGSVGGSRVGSGGSGGRRYSSRRRYGRRGYSRKSSSRKSTSGKAVGTTKAVKPETIKYTSVADVMRSGSNKTATATALAKILKSSTKADYERAASKALSGSKKKDIYKITAKKV